MALYWQTTRADTVYWQADKVTAMYLGTSQIWGRLSTTQVTATGNYTVPAGATRLEVVLLGGGAGGQSGGISEGLGGGAGQWATGSLLVSSIGAGQVLRVTIGTGGTGNTWAVNQRNGSPGNPTVCQVVNSSTLAAISGGFSLTANGGVINASTTSSGQGAGSVTYGAITTYTYTGGAAKTPTEPVTNGNAPGGGGPGGARKVVTNNAASGNGANGQAWIIAYA